MEGIPNQGTFIMGEPAMSCRSKSHLIWFLKLATVIWKTLFSPKSPCRLQSVYVVSFFHKQTTHSLSFRSPFPCLQGGHLLEAVVSSCLTLHVLSQKSFRRNGRVQKPSVPPPNGGSVTDGEVRNQMGGEMIAPLAFSLNFDLLPCEIFHFAAEFPAEGFGFRFRIRDWRRVPGLAFRVS